MAPKPPEFVRIEDNRFVINGQKEMLLTANYIVTFQSDGETIWPSSYQGYQHNKRFTYNNREGSLQKLAAELQMMADMGFNSVRVVQLIENVKAVPGSEDLHLRVYGPDGHGRDWALDSEERIQMFLGGVEDFNTLASEAGLSTILLARIRPDWPESAELFTRVLDAFKEDPRILAYDIYNEPLYFDSVRRMKPEVEAIADDWMRSFRKHDPNHLFTIGLAGIREVFRWDPNILDVDFISFHPYEYEPDQVRNELYWYSNYVDKPWVIGETSIPADNDSVPYSDQVDFAEKTLARACACGAAGYSWWQYKDVKWEKFHPSFMGLLGIDGDTANSKGESVLGHVKPVANVFAQFDAAAVKEHCQELANYYSYDNYQGSALTGRVVNEDGDPVQGAVVLGWNRFWQHSRHTVTQPDGTFELRGEFYFHHWMASATDHTMVRDDVRPNSARTGSDGIPRMHIGTLQISRRE